MAKKEKSASLILDPEEELKFTPPFTMNSSTKLTLSNLFDFPVCFKVQTTYPGRYCVRPKCGHLEPGERLDVVIKLRSGDIDPETARSAKFKILTYRAQPGVTEIGRWLEETRPETVAEPKVKCVFENASAVRARLEVIEEEPAEGRLGEEADFLDASLDGDGEKRTSPEENLDGNGDVNTQLAKLIAPADQDIPNWKSGYRLFGYILIAAVVAIGGIFVTDYYL